jgi:hypothetical protein
MLNLDIVKLPLVTAAVVEPIAYFLSNQLQNKALHFLGPFVITAQLVSTVVDNVFSRYNILQGEDYVPARIVTTKIIGTTIVSAIALTILPQVGMYTLSQNTVSYIWIFTITSIKFNSVIDVMYKGYQMLRA